MTLPPGFLTDLTTAGLSVSSSESLQEEDAETKAADLLFDGFELLLRDSPDDPDTWSVALVWTELFAGDCLVGERALLTPLIGDGLAACANLVVGCLFEIGVSRLSGHVRCMVDRTIGLSMLSSWRPRTRPRGIPFKAGSMS